MQESEILERVLVLRKRAEMEKGELTQLAREIEGIKETARSMEKAGISTPGAMAEMEREQIRERQLDGITIAKEQGRYKGRQRIQVDEKEFKRIVSKWKREEITAREAMKKLGLKSNTFYRRVKALEQ